MKSSRRVVCAALFASIMLMASDKCKAELSQTIYAFRDAEAALAPHYENDDEISLDNPPAAKPLERVWALFGAWAAEYFTIHPSPTAVEFQSAVVNLEGGMQPGTLGAKFVKLEDKTYIVTMWLGPGFGNVFAIAPRNDRLAVVWTISKKNATYIANSDLLGAWTASAATDGGCWGGRKILSRLNCGPITGDVGILSSDARGYPRFYVDAYYPQEAGETGNYQLSIWSWHCHTALPIFIDTYRAVAPDDRKQPTYFDGTFLHVETKDYFKMFESSSSQGRELDWRIRIGPTRVNDLGTLPMVPELDTIDNIYYRVEHQLPTREFASQKAVSVVKRSIDVDLRVSDKLIFPKIGYTAGYWIKKFASYSIVCFWIEAGDGRLYHYLFRILVHNGNQYIVMDSFASGRGCVDGSDP